MREAHQTVQLDTLRSAVTAPRPWPSNAAPCFRWPSPRSRKLVLIKPTYTTYYSHLTQIRPRRPVACWRLQGRPCRTDAAWPCRKPVNSRPSLREVLNTKKRPCRIAFGRWGQLLSVVQSLWPGREVISCRNLSFQKVNALRSGAEVQTGVKASRQLFQ